MTSSTDHPSPQTLVDHARGSAAGPEAAAAADHLARGCPPCIETLRASLAGQDRELDAAARECLRGPDEAPAGAYRAFADHLAAWAVLTRAEEGVAPVLAAEVLGLPAPERVAEIRHNRRYQSLKLAEELTRQARKEVFHEPSRAEELAGLAVEVAEALGTAGYPKTLAADALALAWAARGNARRVAADLFGAERAFRTAQEHLAEGSGWATDELEYLSLLASLRLSQASFPEARRLLEKALALAHEIGVEAQQGRIVLKLAKALGEEGDPEAAVDLLERSAHLLDRPGKGDSSHYRLHGLSWWLVEAGRSREAREVFELGRPLWLERLSGAADRQRITWLAARIAWGEGDRQQAEEELLAVRDAFRDQAAHYDEALVALDLAVLYLEDGRTADVRRLAREMLPVFASRALHRRALQALVLFQRAAETESLTAAWVRALARYLRHARENSFLRFEPPA
jgi:tetratricopeptide (TPR) repeat protein